MLSVKKKWFDLFTTIGVKGVCKERICPLSQDNADNLSFTTFRNGYEPHIHPIFLKVVYLDSSSRELSCDIWLFII